MTQQLTCESTDNKGYGVVTYNEKKYLVSNLLAGEVAEIELFNNTGKVIRILKASVDRVKPVCPVYHVCGGCQLQHMNYKHQLELKYDYVKTCLEEQNIKTNLLEPIGMENPYNYRNKLQIVFSEKKKKIISGFYEENTHKVVNVDNCDIQDQIGNEIITSFKQLMSKHKIKPFVEKTGEGLIRHVVVKRSDKTGQVLVVIITTSHIFPGRNNITKDLRKKHPEITTIVQNVNNRDTSIVLGNEERVLFGTGYIEDILLGNRFLIGSKTFYQVNSRQTEVLYQTAIDFLELKKSDIVLDAYAGVGTIGISLAKYASKVLSVEINPDSVKSAKKNAVVNKVSNIEFFADDASNYIADLVHENIKIDAIVVDPPRAGLDKVFVDSLNELKAKKIVYISCDPKTLSRDLGQLSKLYHIVKVQPVDMFSQTYHIENVVLLTLK